jgi:hypothetical protein
VADYVYACMKVNGETRQALEKCSCSIDVIASIIPYEHYVTAETFRRMSFDHRRGQWPSSGARARQPWLPAANCVARRPKRRSGVLKVAEPGTAYFSRRKTLRL